MIKLQQLLAAGHQNVQTDSSAARGPIWGFGPISASPVSEAFQLDNSAFPTLGS